MAMLQFQLNSLEIVLPSIMGLISLNIILPSCGNYWYEISYIKETLSEMSIFKYISYHMNSRVINLDKAVIADSIYSYSFNL